MKYKKYIFILIGTLVIGGFLYMESQKSHYSVAQISASPGLIDGKTVSGLLVDLHLKDVTLRGTTFKKAKFYGAIFENVIFEDCVFIDSLVFEGTFKNIVFRRGVLAREAKREDYEIHSAFEHSTFENVTFKGTTFKGFTIDGIMGGSIRFINITNVSNYGSNAAAMDIAGNVACNIEVRDCNIKDYLLMVLGNRAKAYITNSTFTRSGVGGSGGAVLYAKNCSFLEASHVAHADTVVVLDSVFDGVMGAQKNAYFVNNKYLAFGSSSGPETANFYFLNKERQQSRINLLGGNYFIHNMELVGSAIQQWDDTPPYIASVNFKDVIIRGGDWEKLNLKSGQWENVQIYPTVDITGSTIENVRGYNVTFPEGPPWKGKSAGGASMTLSKTPFEWPEVHVPTPEELGLIWEWPEVTGAPRGK